MRQSASGQRGGIAASVDEGRIALRPSSMLRALSATFIAACATALALVLVPRLGALAGGAFALAGAVVLLVCSRVQERTHPLAIKVGSDSVVTWHRAGATVRRHRLVGHAQFGARLLVLHLAPEERPAAGRLRSVLIAADAVGSARFRELAVTARRHGRRSGPRRRTDAGRHPRRSL